MVKVSVIIPAYNGDRYIGEAVDSILSQTYSDYEIIVVDDGSTDSTRQVIEQYGSKIQYLSQTNQGVAASRNLGLSKAQGEYIAFLDQDDVFLTHKLASQVALLDQNSSLGIANSGWQIVNQQGDVNAAVKPWKEIPELNLTNLIVWKPVFLGAMLFRRSWLEHTEGFDTTLEQTPDVDLVLRLAAMGATAAWVKQVTVKYRQHEANASKNTLLQAQELDQILERFFSQSNLSPEIKTLESESRYQSLIWSAWRLQQTGYLTKMSDYLYKSWFYSQKYPTEIILNWIKSFKTYSTEYGIDFNVSSLISSLEWQKLIKKCLV
ncbi:glycosyltransferase family 2 protein [Pleurocapsa sp. PCC 7319]|uniref:glycosyltransferase family 2 protein n=1 Tax=Pleurocapsa sp. PCC 7319 TaxID=118161 RepID=UPI00034BBACC|nr:glycosyltransferase family 2 protein [Pleurocapsa sp. PCC 7319]